MRASATAWTGDVSTATTVPDAGRRQVEGLDLLADERGRVDAEDRGSECLGLGEDRGGIPGEVRIVQSLVECCVELVGQGRGRRVDVLLLDARELGPLATGRRVRIGHLEEEWLLAARHRRDGVGLDVALRAGIDRRDRRPTLRRGRS